MPIYEYRCQSCGAELEKLQKLSDPVLTGCPECGRESLVKLVSASSFRLKGGGWYESDFKTGNKKNGLAESATDNATPDASKTESDANKPGSGADNSGDAQTKSGKSASSAVTKSATSTSASTSTPAAT